MGKKGRRNRRKKAADKTPATVEREAGTEAGAAETGPAPETEAATETEATSETGTETEATSETGTEAEATSETGTEADDTGAPPAETPGSALDDLLDAVAREGLSPRDEPPVEEEDTLDLPVYLARAPRVPLEVYVKVVKGERVARAMTRDVSLTGLYLAALTLPVAQPGDAVMVELTLPGAEEPLWAQAEVVRDEHVAGFPALALRFSRLTEADSAALSAYVEGRARFQD